jgi:CarD family transcriptional regulator
MPVSKKTSAAARRAAPARPGLEKKGKAAAKKPVVAKPAAKVTAAAKAKKLPAKAAPAEKARVSAGKKPVVKKPVAAKEPAAAKKPAVKKPTAAKKPAAKKSVAAKEPAKKPAAQPAPVKKAAPAARKKEPKPPAPKPVPPPKPAPSPFAVGDKVVYPHHGAAVIARKEKLPFQGQRTDYFVLEVATDQLILKVPVHKASEQGVRPVISRVVARRVLATFKLPPEEAGANWSRWYKLLTEKINSGDIFQVAEVVRDLTFAQQTKGISPALKRMLSKARLILASELRFALDVSEEEAMRRLDKSLPRVELPEEF